MVNMLASHVWPEDLNTVLVSEPTPPHPCKTASSNSGIQNVWIPSQQQTLAFREHVKKFNCEFTLSTLDKDSSGTHNI